MSKKMSSPKVPKMGNDHFWDRDHNAVNTKIIISYWLHKKNHYSTVKEFRKSFMLSFYR